MDTTLYKCQLLLLLLLNVKFQQLYSRPIMLHLITDLTITDLTTKLLIGTPSNTHFSSPINSTVTIFFQVCSIHYLQNPIMHLYYPSRLLHNHCLQFLLGHENVPREVENNAYADFWWVKEVYYGICASSEFNISLSGWTLNHIW